MSACSMTASLRSRPLKAARNRVNCLTIESSVANHPENARVGSAVAEALSPLSNVCMCSCGHLPGTWNQPRTKANDHYYTLFLATIWKKGTAGWALLTWGPSSVAPGSTCAAQKVQNRVGAPAERCIATSQGRIAAQTKEFRSFHVNDARETRRRLCERAALGS